MGTGRSRRLLAAGAVLVIVVLVPVLRDADDDGPRVARPTSMLTVTDHKDGDSFEASDGREYRVGMVDTPEPGQPCFEEAGAFTRDFLADGFTARPYDEDRYGRVVAEVLDARGRSLNVALAASGLAGDRYLDDFRADDPDLARRLDAAFASAARPRCR